MPDNKDKTIKKDGQANESSRQEPTSVEAKPGKVDGDPLSKILPNVIEGLILVPLAPPAQGGEETGKTETN